MATAPRCRNHHHHCRTGSGRCCGYLSLSHCWFVVTAAVLVPVLLLRQHSTAASAATSTTGGRQQQQPGSFPYLYAKWNDFQASHPVMEHIHPSYFLHHNNNNSTASTTSSLVLPNRPDFLYRPQAHTFRLVEFYVHWCDVCKHFTAHYIQLAQQIQQDLLLRQQQPDSTTTMNITNITVEIYAVSCAPNRDLCRDLNVDQYPLFRLYRPPDCHDDTLCGSNHNNGIDLSHAQIHPATIFQIMGLSSSSSLLLDDPPIHAPSLPSSTTQSADDNNISWWEWGRHFILEGPWITTPTTHHHSPSPAANHHHKKYEIRQSRDDLRHDIHTSFDYAMRYAVYTTTSTNTTTTTAALSAERAAVLQEWLHLLHHTLPISYTTLHQCIQSLIDHYDYLVRSEDYMMAILDEYAPSSSSSSSSSSVWSPSCSYGIVDTGYTCGLWLLLHSVTVGVVDYNRQVAFARRRHSTESVAVTIRNYIEHFFGCDVCRRHFVSTFDQCGHDRCRLLQSELSDNEDDWRQLPLWLLETHNAVNVRLLREKGDREQIVVTENDIRSVIWPLTRDCPTCWLDGTVVTTTAVRPRNDDVMYKYLKVVYGQRDAEYIKYQAEIQAQVATIEATQQSEMLVNQHSNDHDNGDANQWTGGDGRWLFTDQMVAALASFRFYSGMIPTLEARQVATHRFIIRELMDKVFPLNAKHVQSVPSVSHTKSTVLTDWLTLLRQTLPPTWYGLHSLIKELLQNWTYVCKSQDYLLAIVSEYPPPDTINKGFSISSLLERSYSDETMDLLDLLHVVSVGVVQYNKFVVSSDEDRLTTSKVIDTIRQYTSQVFVSSEIKGGEQRLLVEQSMSNICYIDRVCNNTSVRSPETEQDWIALPMWMLQVHNAVLELREAVPKYRLFPAATSHRHFPRTADCSKCWIDSSSRRWNDDNVYKYLILLYGPETTLGVGLDLEFFGPSLWEITVDALHNRVRSLPIPIFQHIQSFV